jgi:hypothetical protein
LPECENGGFGRRAKLVFHCGGTIGDADHMAIGCDHQQSHSDSTHVVLHLHPLGAGKSDASLWLRHSPAQSCRWVVGRFHREFSQLEFSG